MVSIQHTLLIAIFIINHAVVGFQFAPPSIQLSNPAINSLSTYTFTITRSYNGNLSSLTPWNTELVPANSTFDVYFPPEYQTLNNSVQPITCDFVTINDLEVTGSFPVAIQIIGGALVAKISGAITADTAISHATFNLNWVLNPSPALTTREFIIKLGNDVSANSTYATVTFQPAGFGSCSITFNPTTVNTTGAMLVTVVITNPLPRNGSLNIVFPVQWVRDISTSNIIPIGANLTCAIQNFAGLNYLSGLSCFGSYSNQTVTINPLFFANSSQQSIPSNTQITFSISNIFSPPTTEPADTLRIYSAYSITGQSYQVDNCQATITGLTAKPLTVAYTFTVSPLFVNSNSGFRVNYTLSDTISATDYFRLQFPLNMRINYASKLSSIQISTASYNNATGFFVFNRQLPASTHFAGQRHYILFQSFTAPNSIRPTRPIRFVILSSTGFQKQAGTNTVTAVQKTYTSTLTATNLQVSALSNYTIAFTLSDILTTTGYVTLTFPTTISFSACPQLQSSSTIRSTPSCTFSNSTSDFTVTLTNINSSASSIAANQPFVVRLLNVTNYYSAITLSAINIKVYHTSDPIDLVAVSTTNTITLLPGSAYISQISVVNGVIKTLGKPVSYAVLAQLGSGLPAPGVILAIQFDPSVRISSSITSANITCAVSQVSSTNTSFVLQSGVGVVTSASTSNVTTSISIQLSNFTYSPASNSLLSVTLPSTLLLRNPATTSPFSMKISSYDSSNNLIDSGVASVAETFLSPMQISALLISNKTSNTNMAISNYTFVARISGDLILSDYINGSVILITLPNQLTPNSNSQCFSMSTTIINLSCTRNIQIYTVPADQILSYLLNYPTSNINTFQFSFTITNLNNPISLRPTSPFSVSILTSSSSNPYSYAIDNSSLTTQNTITIQFPNVTYNWDITTFGGLQTGLNVSFSSVVGTYGLVFDVTSFNISGYNSTGVHILNTCMSTSLPALSCNLTVTASGNKTIQISNANNLFPSSFTISLINLLLTPSRTPNSSLYIPLSGFDNNQFYIYSSQTMVKFQTICNLPCATCTSALQPNNCLSCYIDPTISLSKYLYSNVCYSQCPSNTFYSSALLNASDYAYTCSLCSSNCIECINVSTYCLSCSSSLYLYQHTINNTNLSECISTCPSTTYGASVTASNISTGVLQCLPCASPCANCTINSTICLNCLPSFYQYINISNSFSNTVECLVQCPIDITVPNVTSMSCVYCLNPCSLCLSLPNNCTSCVAGYFKITNQLMNDISANSTNATFYGYSCLRSCPSRTLSIDNYTCQLCTSPCLTCTNTLSTCLTCISGYLLSSNNTSLCVSVCQQFSFPNQTSGRCQLCSTIASLNCLDCISATQCNRCDDPAKPGYVYFAVNKSCLATVPNGYINSSGTAIPCINNCALCTITTSNCTACVANFNLFFNSSTSTGICQVTCPATYTNISGICQKCLSPCLECVNTLTNCTSCLQQFYAFQGACIIASSCPLYYYINQTMKACLSCPSPCSACSNSTFCLTCSSDILFQSTGTCLAACPTTYAPSTTNKIINGTRINNVIICLPCLSPCQTCLNQLQNCTTCISNYYFYPQVNRCFLPCPALSTVPANINNTLLCVQCVSPCLTCSNLTTSCLSCIQNYYLQINSPICVTRCLDGQYGAVGLCRLCVSPCLTCSSSTLCLTCITNTYLYDNTCVNNCPVNLAIILNNACTPCQDGCKNCSSAASTSNSTCYQCDNPYALYQKRCYTTCPNSLVYYLNLTENKYYCFTQQQYAQAQLGITLTVDESMYLPMPFCVIAVFLSIATFMSRIQSRGTYVVGLLYCWLGLLEVGVLIYFLFGVYTKLDQNGNHITQYKQQNFNIGLIGLGIIGGLNILALLTLTPYLWSDRKFKEWAKSLTQDDQIQDDGNGKTNKKLQSRLSNPILQQNLQNHEKSQCCTHKSTFIVVTIISTLTSYKLKLILFTGLFKFTGLSFPLQSVHKFRAFNVFSFLGMLHEGFIFYFVYLIITSGISYQDNQLLFLQTVDLIVIYSVNLILAILSVNKDENFFDTLLEELDDDEKKSADERQRQLNQQYLKKKKESEIKKKLTSLHPDFIGMNSYQSLRGAGGGQDEQVQQGHKPEAVEEVGNQNDEQLIIQSKSPLKNNLKRQLRSRISQQDVQQSSGISNSHMLKMTNYKSQQQENIVNHNIMNSNRRNKVSNSNWVQVEKKEKEAIQDDYSFADRTILMSKVSNKNKSKIKANSKVKQSNRPTINKNVPSQVTNSNLSSPPKIVNSKIQINNQLDEPINSPQACENILYKKKQTASQQIDKTTYKISIQQVPRKQKTIVQQTIIQQKQSSNKNNKAVIFSEVQQQRKQHQLSFVPILPFVHQDGVLKYKQQPLLANRNIFDPQDGSVQIIKADDDLEQVIHLQAKNDGNKEKIKTNNNNLELLKPSKTQVPANKKSQKAISPVEIKKSQTTKQPLKPAEKIHESKKEISEPKQSKVQNKKLSMNDQLKIQQTKPINANFIEDKQYDENQIQQIQLAEKIQANQLSKQKSRASRQESIKSKLFQAQNQYQQQEYAQKSQNEENINNTNQMQSNNTSNQIQQQRQQQQKSQRKQQIQVAGDKNISQNQSGKQSQSKTKGAGYLFNRKNMQPHNFMSDKKQIAETVGEPQTINLIAEQKSVNNKQKSGSENKSRYQKTNKSIINQLSLNNNQKQDAQQHFIQSYQPQKISEDHKFAQEQKVEKLKQISKKSDSLTLKNQSKQQQELNKSNKLTDQQKFQNQIQMEMKMRNIRDQEAMKKMTRQQIHKYYVYRTMHPQLFQQGDNSNLISQMQKKQALLSKIQNDVNTNLSKASRLKRSRQKLKAQKQQNLQSVIRKKSLSKAKQIKSVKNQSIQMGSSVLNQQLTQSIKAEQNIQILQFKDKNSKRNLIKFEDAEQFVVNKQSSSKDKQLYQEKNQILQKQHVQQLGKQDSYQKNSQQQKIIEIQQNYDVIIRQGKSVSKEKSMIGSKKLTQQNEKIDRKEIKQNEIIQQKQNNQNDEKPKSYKSRSRSNKIPKQDEIYNIQPPSINQNKQQKLQIQSQQKVKQNELSNNQQQKKQQGLNQIQKSVQQEYQSVKKSKKSDKIVKQANQYQKQKRSNKNNLKQSSVTEKQVLTKAQKLTGQVRNKEFVSLDLKNSLVENLSQDHSHNFINAKLFQFDESSLKKPKFQFQQDSEQKLSNPFDGSVHQITNQVLQELQSSSQNDQREDDIRLEMGRQILLKPNNDETVPFAQKSNKYNPITQQNSDMQMSDYNTINRANQQKNENNLTNKHFKLQAPETNQQKIANALKSAHPQIISNQMKKRKRIPEQASQSNKNKQFIAINFKGPTQQHLKQQRLEKKQSVKYPLRQNKLQYRSNDQDQYENIPSQRKNLIKNPNNQKVLQRQRTSNQRIRAESHQQIATKYRKQNKSNLQRELDSHADLIQWKQGFKQIDQSRNNFAHNQSMQVPAKPIIDSEYDQNSSSQNNNRYFDYEQTNKSYHKGKLYQYEQSQNVFERQSMDKYMLKSQQKPQSKRKRKYSRERSSRQKSPRTSLQKIYLQKFDKK